MEAHRGGRWPVVGWSASSGGSVNSGVLRLMFIAGSTREVHLLHFLLSPVRGAVRLGTSLPLTVDSCSR